MESTSQAVRALAARLFTSTLGAVELLTVHVGVHLGLYRTLHERGPLSPMELSSAAGIDRRYAREWLEQQATAQLVEVVEVADDPYRSSFRLPQAHAAVFLEPDHPLFVAPFASFVAGLGGALPDLLAAFRTGAGVPYAAYGPVLRQAVAGMNRPAYRWNLARNWLPALPDIHRRLSTEGGNVLDVGCGEGWSSIAIAEAFSQVRVVGVDIDPASVDAARGHAAEHGLAHRVEFRCAATTPDRSHKYDLVCMFEALHDMADPVGMLRHLRPLIARGGAMLVADKKAARTFTAPGDERERLNYAISVLHCLPTVRGELSHVDGGAMLREPTMRWYAESAGFADVEVLPIGHEAWSFYRLNP
jgi:SAM-dependent methyltransferase